MASGVNNAVARLAGLLGIAVIPALAGIGGSAGMGAGLGHGYATALRISAALCATGGIVAGLMVRRGAPVRSVIHPSPVHACVADLNSRR